MLAASEQIETDQLDNFVIVGELALTGAVLNELPDDLQRLDTPGHTADSVCYIGRGAVFTGDTILGRGSSVVAWPDGNVGDYLKSLEKLMTFGGAPALPGHGPVLPNTAQAARWLYDHRLERLEQVKSALKQGAQTPHEVVDIVYADVEPALKWAAEWSVRAQLEYLS
jgi:glyoxylase-like metal-dependent hydrolase (beta-lactamase superfamily II)